MVRLFGIVNLTRDSFSDGGRFLAADAAIAHARKLRSAGADVLDLGAESTHPDAEDVPAGVEIERLRPVVQALIADGAEVSIDTVKPPVMRAMVELGAQWLNDVSGFRDPEAVAVAAASRANLVVMFSRSKTTKATRENAPVDGLLAEQRAFFADRMAALQRAGVGRERIVLDPGMGFFLGSTPAPSLHVLEHLAELRDLGQPLLVSVSRKSFLGAVTGRDVGARGAASLAAELWAVQQGADYVRTHDVEALRDALLVWRAVQRKP
ncbi:MAG TPA: dihydropteroate synthase [Planctomycetota bacterium]|nr:dihydropteroate synthase [Planctomycetota bacterium]